jgi:hypothetical protein
MKGVNCMIKKIISAIAVPLCICIVFASCSNPTLLMPVDSLLSPPLYTSQYEGLVEVFNEQTGSFASFSNPTGGDNLSAINVTDFDGDGKEEAVILYTTSEDDTVVHMSVYDFFGDKWKFCVDFAGYGDKVTGLLFEDFNNDGYTEIMVNWNYSGINNAGSFSVYSTKSMKMTFSEVITTACDTACVEDMDEDSLKEILYVTSGRDESAITRNAELIKMEDDEFKVLSSIPVDPNITGYVSCKAEKYDENCPMKIYLDAPKSGGMMITEIIYWDKESKTLVAPLYDETQGANTASLRYEQINCADINNDGQIEIPVQKDYDNNDTGSTGKFYLTDWVYFDGSKPVYYLRTFVNLKDGYFINLGSLRYSNIYVRELGSSNWNSWIVCSPSSRSVGGNVLFTVTSVSAEKYDSKKYSSYITVMQNSDSVICVSINSKNIDSDLIKKTVMKIPS